MANWLPIARSALPGLILLLTGCSSFHGEWKRAATTAPSAEALAGRWEGNWLSDVNGHHGRLRCLITPLGGERYRARYHAHYLKILRFGYTAEMQAAREPDGWSFAGEASLGVWGTYRYQGNVIGTNFTARYETGHDRGVFRLQRPP